ncbi:Vms1/Ankzf1 family peptidyl-tRNA hydrolase [Arthrobacter sp. SIMBA_036]|uniref:Vms1/Ankzf1 family peptidyl-tRNA hydrolase n=1 Tax=Arthrobacter sp. SIMBA_036 TaxID=3085778 RepID=UPI00397BC9D3
MERPSASARLALVPAPRLHGWVERFAASHGAIEEDFDDDGLLLTAGDGATALLRAPWPVNGRPGRGASNLDRLVSLAAQERRLGILLVRRGGFAVAAASGSAILASKSGKRHSDPKTTADFAAGIFNGQGVEYIVPGGDRVLVDQVLAHPLLKAVAGCTRLSFLDIQEPRSSVLAKAAADACAIRITVKNP